MTTSRARRSAKEAKIDHDAAAPDPKVEAKRQRDEEDDAGDVPEVQPSTKKNRQSSPEKATGAIESEDQNSAQPQKVDNGSESLTKQATQESETPEPETDRELATTERPPQPPENKEPAKPARTLPRGGGGGSRLFGQLLQGTLRQAKQDLNQKSDAVRTLRGKFCQEHVDYGTFTYLSNYRCIRKSDGKSSTRSSKRSLPRKERILRRRSRRKLKTERSGLFEHARWRKLENKRRRWVYVVFMDGQRRVLLKLDPLHVRQNALKASYSTHLSNYLATTPSDGLSILYLPAKHNDVTRDLLQRRKDELLREAADLARRNSLTENHSESAVAQKPKPDNADVKIESDSTPTEPAVKVVDTEVEAEAVHQSGVDQLEPKEDFEMPDREGDDDAVEY